MLGIHLFDQKRRHDLLQGDGILGRLDERHFKKAVVEHHLLADHVTESSHGAGIGHHAEDKLVFQRLPVVSYTDPVGRHVEQPLGALQHVGQMTQHIFHSLFGLIGDVGKKAECGNIDEDIIIKMSHIAGERRSVHRVVRRAQKPFGDMKAVGEIIGGPCGDIAHRHPVFPPHHPGHHLVDGTVSAAAHHQVKSAGLKLLHFLVGVPVRLGGIGHHLVSGFYENVNDIRQLWFDQFFPRMGIVDKQHPFHDRSSLNVERRA